VKKTSAIFVVDAITGLGTMPLAIEEWGLDVVIGGSQKSFMVPPGIAFLSISDKAWAMMDTATIPHYYFNLKKERKVAKIGEAAWTPAIAVLLGLAEALTYIKTLGMAGLVENAQQLARAMRAACLAMGLELFAPESPSAAVTAVKSPNGIDSSVIVKEFRNRFGSIIANGQGPMKGRIFRIAHLGYFDFPDLFAIVTELELILEANGFPVKLGSGVNAVQQVYADLAMRENETIKA